MPKRSEDLQDAQAEDADEDVPLPLGQVEPFEHWDGEDEDQDVRDDVARGVDLPEGVVADADGVGGRLPVGGHGVAVEDGDKQLRDGLAADEDGDAGEEPDGLLAGVPEDAVVLGQERHLDGRQAGVVEDDGDV